MREIGLITLISIKNNLRLKIVLMIYIAVTIICVLGIIIALCIFLIAPEMNTELPDRSKLEMYLGLIMYSTCFICLGVNLNAFAYQSMIREKSRGNIESLLATPLEAKHIWIARSIAIFIPGLVLGEVLTFIVLIAVNYIYFVPEIGFIFNNWLAISSFVTAPLIYLSLSFLFHIVALTGKPATGNVIIQVFLPVVINLIINLVVRNILDGTSWPFTVVNFGIAAVVAIIVIFLKPHLTKERIVLSR
jgi:ABC-2 type transport system permease protein